MGESIAEVAAVREQVAQIIARAYGGSLAPGLGTPGDYPTDDVDYIAADAILEALEPEPGPYLLGKLDERKAIVRFLTVRASRALINGNRLPWWSFRQRRTARLAGIAHALMVEEIEKAQHVQEQAVWVVDIDGGMIFGREARRLAATQETTDHAR